MCACAGARVCVWVMTIAHLGLKVRVIGQGQTRSLRSEDEHYSALKSEDAKALVIPYQTRVAFNILKAETWNSDLY